MRKTSALKLAVCCLLLASIVSCKKQEVTAIQKTDQSAIFPTTEKEKQSVAVLRDVGYVLQTVYRKPKARYEAISAIKTGFYQDERILLRDLLFPESSPVYATEKFKASGAATGEFKKYFFEALNAGNYTALKEAMGFNNSTRSMASGPGVDSTNEIWTDQNGVSIYFPYSENFPFVSPLDASNNTAGGNMVTIIYADREADSAPGWEPYYFENPDPMGFQCMDNICYRDVTVDDDYAETHPTNIVGVGAEPARVMTDPPPPSTNVNRVFHGWSRLTQQLDHLISFTGNGGGSEIKVGRISGYLQVQNQQVTSFAGDLVTVSYSRKDIRKKRWKRVYSVWDADWVPANLEQVYAVWEDDTEGTKTFTGSLGTSVRVDSSTNATITGNIGFNVTVKTQDEIVTQHKITRTAYFGAAKADQAWGYQMCDDKGCRYDDTFLPSGQHWPIYDGGTIWGYTWPYNSY